MATRDVFADVDCRLTGAATTIDLQAFDGAAFLLVAGATPGTLTLEDSPDDSNWTAIDASNLNYIKTGGVNVAGIPTLTANDVVVLRYNGEERYIRGSGDGTEVVYALRGMPDRAGVPQTDIPV